jgi:hypothetical protein
MAEASRIALLFCAILLFNLGGSSAIALMQRPHSDAFLFRVAATCLLPGGRPVPTEALPLEDSKLIAKMRKAGQLPDTFVCGRYRYDIAGDPGTTYYVKTRR